MQPLSRCKILKKNGYVTYSEKISSHSYVPPPLYGTQASVAGTVTRLQGRGYGVQIPVGARDSFLYQNIQTSSRVHPASYLMGVWGYFAGGKVAGA